MVLVYSQPAAEISFWVTVGVWGIGERFLTFRDFRSGAWKGKQDAGSYLWVVAGVIGGFALASARALTLPAPVVWLVVGLIVAWAGMLLRLWSVLTLGRLFTTKVQLRPEQRVITSGPYRLVRHPSYLGVLILFFGLGLALGDLASAVAMAVLPAIGLVRRIRVEEAALRARARGQLHRVLQRPSPAHPGHLVGEASTRPAPGGRGGSTAHAARAGVLAPADVKKAHR